MIGLATVWGVVGGWLVTAFADAVEGGPRYENWRFKPNGQAVVASWDQSGNWKYRDLQNHTLDIPDDPPWLTGTILTASRMPRKEETTDWNQRIRSFSDGKSFPPAYWYFVAGGARAPRAYFIGYDRLTSSRVGFLVPGGFQQTEPPPEARFAFTVPEGGILSRVQSSQRQYNQGAAEPRYTSFVGPFPTPDLPPYYVYVLDDLGKVWRIDLRHRDVRIAFDESPVVAVGMMWFFLHDKDIGQMRVAVRTADAVITMNGKNDILRRVPIPEELRERDFTWAETTREDVVVYYALPRDPWDDVIRYRLLHLDLQGNIKSDEEVALSTKGQSKALRAFTALWLPGPLPLALDVAGFVPPQIQTTWPKGYWAALSVAVSHYLPAVLIVFAIGLACAIGTYRREARYASTGRERWLWSVFAFLFGLPGWIGYRYSRAWPVLEACPGCGSDIPLDQLRCGACRSEIAKPVLLGTEVFA
jgi:hypothetical protein